MFGSFRRMLGRGALCGAALMSLADGLQAQSGLPVVPQTQLPMVIPAAQNGGMKPGSVLPVVGQAPALPVAPPSLLATPAPNAAATPTSTNNADELKARIDRLEKQNQDLMEMLKGMKSNAPVAANPAPVEANQGGALNKNEVQKIIGDYLNQRDAQAKAADEAKAKADQENGFVVGKNLGLNGVFTTGSGSGAYQPWLESRDKAYRMHVGARIQPDVILGANSDDNVSNGKGGTGPFLEGFNFRRARLEVDGWLHENIDYFVEFDWANTPFNTGVKPGNITGAGTPTGTQPFSNILNVPAPTDVWAGINYIPVIGGVRVGNLKPAIGLDHLTSSRFLDFMERSIGFDTYFNRNNGFEPGFMFYNNTENKMATYQVSITRTCNGPFGFDQGGGAWDYSGRLTWTPWYEDNGRRMIHLGLGAKYQILDKSTGTGVANFNDRWLLRNSQSGLQNVVSLAVLNGIDQEMINPEFFMNLGPLSVQAEYLGSRVNGVTAFSTQLTPKAVTVPSTTFYSSTWYVQALYFLTGEHRPYGQTALHGSGAAPTRVVPYKNFYWVPGQGGGNPFSSGAWQVGARYCHSTLDSGIIHGGIIDEVTLGLTWFLNPNMRFQWNYDIGYRELQGGTSDGFFSGFGMRMCFDF